MENKTLEELSKEQQKSVSAEVGISFHLNKEQMEGLLEAEKILKEKVGLSFDTGFCNSPLGEGLTQRDWEWDWSLNGNVIVKFKRFVHDYGNIKSRFKTK